MPSTRLRRQRACHHCSPGTVLHCLLVLLVSLFLCERHAHALSWAANAPRSAPCGAPQDPSRPAANGKPPLTEDQALELAKTLSKTDLEQELDGTATATKQSVGRCAGAMGAAISKGENGQPYSDPEQTHESLDPARLVGGRHGNGPLPGKEDRERVYRFAYELGRRRTEPQRAQAATLLFAVRLFGRGAQPAPQSSTAWGAVPDSAGGALRYLGKGNSAPGPLPEGYPVSQLWRSEEDRCIALFPDKPQRVEAAMPGGTGHAHQGYFRFDNEFRAMAQVTVTPLAENLKVPVPGRFLKLAHDAYVRTVGAAPADSVTGNATFGNDKPALEFEVRYSIDGVSVVSTGYWILDGNRVLRVKVVHPTALPANDVAVARHFPRTFGLVERVPVTGTATPAEVNPEQQRNSNFVLLPLPKGVTVELPRNWVAMTDNARVTLDTYIQSMHDLAGVTRPESDLPFAANLYDDSRNVLAMFNVRFYPRMEWSQEFARGLPEAQIEELDTELRKQTEESLRAINSRLLEWKPTKRSSINGITAFVVEYRRAGAREGTSFCVRLVRVLNEGKSFTVTVSYREDAGVVLRPICDRIIQSVKQ